MDVIELALCDTVIYVDDSGSVKFEENGSWLTQLRHILGLISTAASNLDSDEFTIRFINSDERRGHSHSSEGVMKTCYGIYNHETNKIVLENKEGPQQYVPSVKKFLSPLKNWETEFLNETDLILDA